MSAFLTAQWRDLVMLNWPIDPAAFAARVPAGTELDLWDGRCFVSLVAFRFLGTRVRGVVFVAEGSPIEVHPGRRLP